MIPGFFITATGTDCGKTFVTRGLARALVRKGRRVAAIKPLETGVTGSSSGDAHTLARACGRSDLADASDLFRAELPLAPYASSLETGSMPPEPTALASRVEALASGSDLLLVEGAGGLLVPLDRERTMADLAACLGLPLLIIAPDRLGVLSHVLTLIESALQRRLSIAAVILSQPSEIIGDPSCRTNARILRERLAFPILQFPFCRDDDDLLADAAVASGLTPLLDVAP